MKRSLFALDGFLGAPNDANPKHGKRHHIKNQAEIIIFNLVLFQHNYRPLH